MCKVDMLQYALHTHFLRKTATEIFETKTAVSLQIVGELFIQRNNNYNLIHFSNFGVRNVRSIFHDIGSISFLGSKILDIVLANFKIHLVSLSK